MTERSDNRNVENNLRALDGIALASVLSGFKAAILRTISTLSILNDRSIGRQGSPR